MFVVSVITDYLESNEEIPWKVWPGLQIVNTDRSSEMAKTICERANATDTDALKKREQANKQNRKKQIKMSE